MMINKQRGFTLVELMITMVIFVLVIAATSTIFTGLLNQFKQQSKIAETNIGGIMGLQMLKSDMEQAGYGLPYDLDGVTYNEAVNYVVTAQDDTAYNDSTGNPPRPIVATNNNGINASDIVAIKATNVAISPNEAAHKWTYIANADVAGVNQNTIKIWRDSAGAVLTDENLTDNVDRVIVLNPTGTSTQRILLNNGGTFYTTFRNTVANFADAFEPVISSYQTHLVYGITTTVIPRMPFNRADFYIRAPAGTPARCAPGTGVLYKATVNHGDEPTTAVVEVAGQLTEIPLLDCVADMQITLGLDIDENGEQGTVTIPGGTVNTTSEGATSATINATLADADLIRKRLKEIRVYILAHEGQRDTAYTYPNATIDIVDPDIGAGTPLKAFDLSAVIGATYTNYRWRVYTLVMKPYNMR